MSTKHGNPQQMTSSPCSSGSQSDSTPPCDDGTTHSRKRELWALILNTVLPGFGHIVLGHPWSGLLIFTLFSTMLNAAVMSLLLRTGGDIALQIRPVAPVLALAIWLFAVVRAWQLGLAIDRTAAYRRRRTLLREGLLRYVVGNLEEARGLLEQAVAPRLDPDREEVDALFHLGVLCLRSGDRIAARRAFRRLEARDRQGKWRSELARQRRLLRQAPTKAKRHA